MFKNVASERNVRILVYYCFALNQHVCLFSIAINSVAIFLQCCTDGCTESQAFSHTTRSLTVALQAISRIAH